MKILKKLLIKVFDPYPRWSVLNSMKTVQIRGIYTRDPINLDEPKFEKLLVANRGEIACRIISSAKKMGIKTVAIYSVADSKAKHVKLADEAILIGGPASSDSYLNIPNIIAAAKSTGSEAIHPGYGFLSENATFVELLQKENISFVGPSLQAITGMGDKLKSKRFAREAGVNIIPGFDGIISDAEHCVAISRNIGYPVIIKASAGGGGMGMRVARNDYDARDGFKIASQEALSNFGDGRLLVEKYIENPRHIEIQVLGDKHGNVIHLFERECSIQRRNQKVIEEAPSTFLDEITRENMGAQAVNLCRKLGYYSAGTVEFLINQNRHFYFLEMNTRLQVEHTITECITGIDLVQQMLRIAKGHKLNITQDEIEINGWAIESRIYAEDPYKNFGLPCIGKLFKYIEPTHLKGVRCDSGIENGSEISIYYDAMIAKLICHGKDRNEAIEISVNALDSYVIRGITHNVPLLRDILTEKRFIEGDISTNYLNQVYGKCFQHKELTAHETNKLLTIATGLYINREIRNMNFLNGQKIVTSKHLKHWDLQLELLGIKYNTMTALLNNKLMVNIENNVYEIKNGFNLAAPIIDINVNEEKVVMQLVSKHSNGEFQIIYNGTLYQLNIIPKAAADLYHFIKHKPKIDFTKIIKSPMPGLVRNVFCNVGDNVIPGQKLCIIEAMKMQNCLSSEITGTVKMVHIKDGDSIGDEDTLIVLE